MELKVLKNLYHCPALLWLGITLLVWWTGLGGRDLYLLPALIFLLIYIYRIWKNKPLNIPFNLTKSFFEERLLIFIFLVHVTLFLAITILKYYSFSWNVWDVGNFSNKLYNIAQGRFYSSYLGAHDWADHFNPSMSPLALLYLLVPSTNWLTLAKTIAYVSVPPLIYQISREFFDNKEKAWLVTVILALAWMLIYAPALNSLYYEFQPSSLAPPFILYAFLCFTRKRWLIFWLLMFLLLGLKEHLGAVWIGFGFYMVLATPQKKMGLFLIAGGVIAVYMIIFKVMPYYRNYQDSWSMVLGPFQDIPEKLVYLFKILIPFGFLPLIFWRFGIIAGPAIGVNLLSGAGRPQMYSTSFHYDDIPSTLLMIAMILSLSSLSMHKIELLKQRKMIWWISAAWMSFLISLMPSSPLRVLFAAIPNQSHWEIRQELIEFDKLSKDDSIAVQTSLGPQFNRTNISAITQDRNGNCAPLRRGRLMTDTKYLVFAKSLNHYLIDDLEECISMIRTSSDYKMLHGFRHLDIFIKFK